MEFVWIDKNARVGHYRLQLFDNGKKLEDMYIYDFTNENYKANDMKNKYPRPYAFEVGQAGMKEGFDYDELYDEHFDENGEHIGGFQGVCTHTLEDVREWCENYLAQGYMMAYQRTLETLDDIRRRAEWFESEGFVLGGEGRHIDDMER